MVITENKKRFFSQDSIINTLSYIVVTIFAITMLYPILNVFAVSMSSYASYARQPWMIIPFDFNFAAYKAVFTSRLILRSYGNTIIITLVGTISTLFITMLTAYPLSRPGLRGKSVFMSLLLFTMIFNGGMIPNFLLIRGLGMYDTLWAQIIPAILSAYNTILMINFFKALPPSLFEAAKVDGASEPFILFKIVFPLSKAIIATIALFAAVGYWNNYFSGVLYARSQENWPLQLVLREIIMSANTAIINTDGNMAEMDLNSISSESLRYATLVVVMVPIMCIYPFLQKYFAKGVMLGAVKE